MQIHRPIVAAIFAKVADPIADRTPGLVDEDNEPTPPPTPTPAPTPTPTPTVDPTLPSPDHELLLAFTVTPQVLDMTSDYNAVYGPMGADFSIVTRSGCGRNAANLEGFGPPTLPGTSEFTYRHPGISGSTSAGEEYDPDAVVISASVNEQKVNFGGNHGHSLGFQITFQNFPVYMPDSDNAQGVVRIFDTEGNQLMEFVLSTPDVTSLLTSPAEFNYAITAETEEGVAAGHWIYEHQLQTRPYVVKFYMVPSPAP